MKTALCAIGKNENDYILEFVEWYYNLGFTKLFLYDNNDVDGERFEDVIGDYISNGFVEIIDYRGKKVCQLEAYNECYKAHNSEYDWMAFFDCDEFLVLRDSSNISDFLSQDKFDGCGIVHVNWLCYGDCGHIDNPDKRLNDYFTSPILPIDFNTTYSISENRHVKSIVRNGLDCVFEWCSHTPSNHEIKCCNAEGGEESSKSPFTKKINLKSAYLKHFITKSIDEYVSNKMKRGYPDQTEETSSKSITLDRFFSYNILTDEKVKYVKDKYGIDYNHTYLKSLELNQGVNLDMYVLTDKDLKVVPNKSEYKVILNDYNIVADCPNDVMAVVGGRYHEMRDCYGDGVGLYFIWKNLILKDYVGIVHCDKYFSFFDKVPNYNEMKIEFERADAIFPKPLSVLNIRDHYKLFHNVDDLDEIGDIIKNNFDKYANFYDKTIENGNLLCHNMFIMKKEDFNEYCKFVFGVLDEYDKRHGFNCSNEVKKHVEDNKDKYLKHKSPYDTVEYQMGIQGFLIEILTNIFVRKQFNKILSTNTIDINDTANKKEEKQA